MRATAQPRVGRPAGWVPAFLRTAAIVVGRGRTHLAVLLAFFLFGPPAGGQTSLGYTDLGLLISSRGAGRYGYGYAPAILREDGRYHMVFCSYGRPGIWDYLRYAVSDDGVTWSRPAILLEGTDLKGERAACDPAVVRYRAPGDAAPFWYLFYSGNAEGVQTAMFVARAERIDGPYAKWTRRGTWEVGAGDPATILEPANPKADGSGFYGAGQQSVVVEGGRLVSWYVDDTTCPVSCARLFRTESRDPTAWPRGQDTEVSPAHAPDVKRDGAGYVLYAAEPAHAPGAALVRRRSADGRRWGLPEPVCDADCLPDYAHNAGIAADASGQVIRDGALVVYAAPAREERNCGACLGRWDLFGGIVAAPSPRR